MAPACAKSDRTPGGPTRDRRRRSRTIPAKDGGQPDRMAPRGASGHGAGQGPRTRETTVSDDQPPPPGWGQPSPPPAGAQPSFPAPGAPAPGAPAPGTAQPGPTLGWGAAPGQ